MRCGPLLLLSLAAANADAQTTDPARRSAGAAVSGVVHDSIAGKPLARAIVQLVVADGIGRSGHTTVSDSLGRYALLDVPTGRYTLGFFHPVLDSLGVEAPVRAVYVEAPKPVRADLAIPSPARIRAAICDRDSTVGSVAVAVVVGIVRNASDGAPAAHVSVAGEWLELSLTPAGIVRHMPRLVATTGDNGWFALCNVPRGGTMSLSASRGGDSSAVIEVDVPADGFLRRELYLGTAQSVGRLSGTVVTAVGKQPIAGARVNIAGSPETRTNERGEWALSNAPSGTRMLEVRSVGYYPDSRPVDVVDGAPPVRVALSTLRAVVDTVRIKANRISDRHFSGFEDRRRSGAGRFLTAQDIAKRNPDLISDVLRTVPGIYYGFAFDTLTTDMQAGMATDSVGQGEKRILMRGIVGNVCAPTIFLDGLQMTNLAMGDIDSFAHPKVIAGIEVYSSTTAPVQFQRAHSGCGSVVIWTK